MWGTETRDVSGGQRKLIGGLKGLGRNSEIEDRELPVFV